MSQRSFSITPVPPFRLDFTVPAFRRRPENAVDRWDGKMVDSQAVEVAVRQSCGPEEPQLEVDLTSPRLTVQQAKPQGCCSEHMLGVHKDFKLFYRLVTSDPRLQPLVDEFHGLKPPQFPTVFEAVANGIACQQLSLLVGILLLSRLALAQFLRKKRPWTATECVEPSPDGTHMRVSSISISYWLASRRRHGSVLTPSAPPGRTSRSDRIRRELRISASPSNVHRPHKT